MDRYGLPLSACTHADNHHDVTPGQFSFDFYMMEAKPEKLIADRLRQRRDRSRARQDRIDLTAPHRATRKLKTRDVRRLRRRARRWIIERLVAGLQYSRWLLRWVYCAASFLSCVQMASSSCCRTVSDTAASDIARKTPHNFTRPHDGGRMPRYRLSLHPAPRNLGACILTGMLGVSPGTMHLVIGCAGDHRIGPTHSAIGRLSPRSMRTSERSLARAHRGLQLSRGR